MEEVQKGGGGGGGRGVGVELVIPQRKWTVFLHQNLLPVHVCDQNIELL